MNIIFLGRYNKSEILTGPEKVAKRIFHQCTAENKTYFIEYFFNGNIYGLKKKLFGREKVCEVNGSEVLRLGIYSLFTFLIKMKPDIIHIISFERFALVAFLYRAFLKSKIVYTLHGLVVCENKYYGKQNPVRDARDKIAENIFVKHSDRLVFLSSTLKKLFDKQYYGSKKKIAFINNGADEEFYETEKIKNTENLKLVFIADVRREEKGFGFLKDALEKLNAKIELHIVDNKSNDKSLIFENKNIEAYFYDKMNTEELASFLQDKDIFISSSSYEPFGLTTVECMSAGLVPVVTSETGASELISDGVNGFICDYGDSEKFKSILNKLSENISLLRTISQNSKKVFEKINWEKIYYGYKIIYEEVLKQ